MNRLERITSDIKYHICNILSSEIKNPRIGFITVTEVEVSPNLENAKIYFTVLGTDKQKQDTQEALKSASGFIRSQLAARMKIRRVPILDFRIDAASEYGKRIDDIIEKIHKQDKKDNAEN